MSHAVPALEFRSVGYADADVTALVEEVQAEYVVRYGGPDATPVEPGEFGPPHGAVLVASLAGEPVGMGMFRRHDAVSAEVKRMFVRTGCRNRGYARAILAELEARVRRAGYRRIVLETGSKQPEAIALYESSGYSPIAPFGHYKDSPGNRCFAKDV